MEASAIRHLPRGSGARPRARSTVLAGPELALAGLVAAAVAVRLWLMLGYGPAFLGFGDSHEYVTAAARGVFADAQKPAGYPIFLAALHLVSDRLVFTILVQHLLGIASGLLLYAAVARSGAPRWLGLPAAAVAFFGGTGLLLEHSLLADPLFDFLQAAALYCGVRAMSARGWRWAAAAGLAAGAAFWVKTVGIADVVLLAAVLLAGAAGARPARARRAGVAVAGALALVGAYPVVQGLATGYWGYERQAAWNLYGRVATFVDCTHFSPPAGTRFLCPSEPRSRRASESWFQYGAGAPAVRAFGGPSRAPASANGLLERFSVAAIEHEPLAYAGAILDGLAFYVSPRAGEGYTPSGIRTALLDPKGTASIEPAIAAYYPGGSGYRGGASSLDSYEGATRIQGPLLVAILILALLGPPLLRGRARWVAVLALGMALGPVILADAGNSYDARYGYPAFGALALAAALGAHALVSRARSRPLRPGAGSGRAS